MENQIEEIRLLARFKLQVRRVLNQSVDLERMRNDHAYARVVLTKVEENADDEELLVLAMRLHDLLLSRPAGQAGNAPSMPGATMPEPNKYMFGARS